MEEGHLTVVQNVWGTLYTRVKRPGRQIKVGGGGHYTTTSSVDVCIDVLCVQGVVTALSGLAANYDMDSMATSGE